MLELLGTESASETDATASSKALDVSPSGDSFSGQGKTGIEDVLYGSVKFLSPWFPSMDPQLSTWRSKRSRRQFVTWTCFGTAFIIFSLNLVLSTVCWAFYKAPNDIVATLYQGDCDTSKRLDTSLHVVINILSTLLLSSSNLCLQLLLSPTRAEIDQAHSERRWLDIGVASWRNFVNLPVWSRIIWAGLATSSIPIHFL